MGAARLWLILGALNGLLAVAAGAYGRHRLEVSDTGLSDIFEIGVHYQMWHALALLAVAWLAERGQRVGEGGVPTRASPARAIAVAGAAFTAGIVLFSGSLYAFAVTGSLPVTGAAPAGGLLFMVGWAALIWAAVKRR